jgi:hypothetical protein
MSINLSKKKHLKRLIDYHSDISFLESKIICHCFRDKINKTIQSYNDSTQSNSMRISDLVSSTLGGKTTFGNFNRPAKITYLGGIEGQSGGSPRPLRNRF